MIIAIFLFVQQLWSGAEVRKALQVRISLTLLHKVICFYGVVTNIVFITHNRNIIMSTSFSFK